jgi:hypothetical protein
MTIKRQEPSKATDPFGSQANAEEPSASTQNLESDDHQNSSHRAVGRVGGGRCSPHIIL